MPTQSTQASGQNTAGGAGGDSNANANNSTSGGDDVEGSGNSGDVVAYETHRKLLAEKKRMQEDRDRLQAELDKRTQAEQAAETKRLEEQGEYKKLLDLERKQRLEVETKLNQHTITQREAKKLGAVIDALENKVPKKFWGLIDTDSVVINPETGEVDAMSVQKTVEVIRAAYPEIIRSGGNGARLPADAAQGTQGSISYEEWLKLPAAEMKKRYHEVKRNDAASS